MVVVSAIGAYVLWPRDGTPVSEEDALADFRERDDDHEAGGSSDLPEPGVYTYDAEGEERVRLGVLPTEERTIPSTVTAVVVADGDGCTTWTLNLLAEHVEDTTYCGTPDGTLAVEDHVKHQRIGPLSPEGTMACDPAALLVRGQSETTLACTLTLSGGPVEVTATLAGTSDRIGLATVVIDGEQVEAVELELSYDVTGDLSGSWAEHLWLHQQTGLPLRIERTLDLHGLATFSEQTSLALTSLEPAR